MIIQHQGKLTIKEIEKISGEGDCLVNFYNTPKYPNLRPFWAIQTVKPEDLEKQFEINHRIYGGSIAKLFGTPNCNMRGYESYPGAWVFYDTEYNVRWLVFSDGIRKGCFKGTSYEVTIPDNFSETDFIKAIRKFFGHFGCIPAGDDKVPI